MFVRSERARCAGGVRRSPYLRVEALSTAAQPSALTHGMRGAQGAAESLIEAPAAGTLTLTEDVPPKSFVARTGPLGRTNGEWLGFLPACGSATLLAFGLTADCPLIPGLNAFCIAFCSRRPRQCVPRTQASHQVQEEPGHRAEAWRKPGADPRPVATRPRYLGCGADVAARTPLDGARPAVR